MDDQSNQELKSASAGTYKKKEPIEMPALILWLLGVPITLIILLYLAGAF